MRTRILILLIVLFGVFSVLPLRVAHAQQSASSQGPQRGVTRSPHGPLNKPCENCHTFTSWSPIRNIPEFDHNQTRYPLRGMHANVACRQCHVSLVFSNISTKCADCHADIHKRQFGANCEQCHTVKGWQVTLRAVKQHENRFPLLGAHASVECEACHKNAAVGRFEGLSTACISCHSDAFQKAAIPNHVSAQFPTTCDVCHSMDGWPGAKFDHGKFTGFMLSGAHAQLDCSVCHVGGKFQGMSANCFSCHAKDYTSTTNPNHVQAGFPQTCSMCHNTSTWAGAKFDHNTFTKFPLTGAHATLACTQCHANGRFAGTPTDCGSCHLATYQKTTNPNHVQAGFPLNCAQCHTTQSWLGATFDHSKFTKFPLTGAHATLTCTQCHANGQFAGTSANCVSCHLKDYQGTTNPSHATLGFPQTCSMCHSTVNWLGATFDHNTFTKFPLTGVHATTPCMQCHVGGKFVGTSTQCSACHLTDYQKTTNPNHTQAGFPTDCSICHTTSGWLGAKFDHSKTKFPLTGMHASQPCAACHSSGQYATLSTACVSCHLKDYNGTNNPNHAAAGYPQTCDVCHSTAAWMPANFSHTIFPLTGKHATTPCANCHINNVFAGTPTACYACHKTEYQNVANPNHVAAGFPTTCDSCHNTSNWLGAVFNHTWFPIYSGKHAGKWTTCGDCHVNASNFAVFSCLTCHAHDKAPMDSKHQGVSGYVYNSANCYQCHPTGQAD